MKKMEIWMVQNNGETIESFECGVGDGETTLTPTLTDEGTCECPKGTALNLVSMVCNMPL